MIDKKWIGHELPASVLPIERSRLQFFAKANGETDPVYTDAAAARDAGYPDLPAPPTFLFAAELESGAAFQLIEDLQIPIAKLLHGEQSFIYHANACAGDTVTVRSTVSEKVTGFVFKIQANMDPKHRDRIAFTRICSGDFKRGMKLFHTRTEKQMVIHSPLMFFAQDREMVEDAYAGDIIGIPNHGNLRIGDVLTEGEKLKFTGIPSFAPEYLQRIVSDDPLKAKHLGNALQQLAEEGVARVFKTLLDNAWIVGVVGMLQFDVLANRIRTEYNLPVKLEPTSLYTARWVFSEDATKLKLFLDNNRGAMAIDHDGDPVFMARNAWHLNDTMDKNPAIKFTATKSYLIDVEARS